MVVKQGPDRWRAARRESARAVILDAAWAFVREESLPALSLRRLATAAGVTTPTVYAYFASKNAIYDAMFAQAASQFEVEMTAPYGERAPHDVLVEGLKRFLAFCTADTVRYQLLFERVIPDFEPSPAAYGHAVTALDVSRAHLAAAGVTDPGHVDLWTALTTGLASQQIANEPHGQRWIGLAADATAMFLAHCRPNAGTNRHTPPARRARGSKEPRR